MSVIRGLPALALALFISVSMVAGLELTASTGDNGAGSSTTVEYGATEDDYASEHIGLNPDGGTLSNAFTGTGNLRFSSINIRDRKGNYATVSRSIYGKAKTTTWNYDWKTYTSTSASGASGVGAWLSLTASNAYGITGSGYASNREGDAALASVSAGSASCRTTTSIANYYVNPVAYSGEVSISQSADSITSTGPIRVLSISNNKEKDYAGSSIYLTKGTIISPTANAYSNKTYSGSSQSASSIITTGTSQLYSYASNREKDSSMFELTLINGTISAPSFQATSAAGYANTTGSVSDAYGKYVEIDSQGLDRSLGYQEHWAWNKAKKAYVRIKTKVERGEGDFAAVKTNGDHFGSVSVSTSSTKSDVVISSTGFGSNTALILDPRRWEFVTDVGGKDIRDSVMTSLKNKGYAVTYYSDSAVSKDKVKQMDEYRVSAITTHANSYGISLSKSSDGKTWDTMTASELKSEYTNNNGMALVIGCDSFTDRGDGTWADALSKAEVSGGTTSSWGIVYSRGYINKFFKSMGNGNNASSANNYAAGLSGEKLLLLGNESFTL